jgi:cell division protein FtsQ
VPQLGESSRPGARTAPRRTLVVLGAVGAAALVALVVVFVLSLTPAFTISHIDTDSTEHLSAEAIAKLANVGEGTTLLGVDTDAIESNVKKNPWVKSVSVTREFPDSLKLEVNEHDVEAIVVMASGDVAWYLSDDGTWIEPLSISSTDSSSSTDVALAKAMELGCLLIKDVPASVAPAAGSQATDDEIEAVLSYQKTFSSSFSSQVCSYSAASTQAISCILDSGVEISLGAPTNISTKESVASKILSDYDGQVTYINVRVPSQPSYRKVSSDSVQQGSGVVSSATTGEAATTDPSTTAATTSAAVAATTTDADGTD